MKNQNILKALRTLQIKTKQKPLDGKECWNQPLPKGRLPSLRDLLRPADGRTGCGTGQKAPGSSKTGSQNSPLCKVEASKCSSHDAQ